MDPTTKDGLAPVKPGDRFLRLPEVEKKIGFTVRTLRTMHYQQGQGEDTGYSPIPFRKLGRMLGVLESELEQWMKVEISGKDE